MIVWFVYSSAVRECTGSDPADAVVVMSVFFPSYVLVKSSSDQYLVISECMKGISLVSDYGSFI